MVDAIVAPQAFLPLNESTNRNVGNLVRDHGVAGSSPLPPQLMVSISYRQFISIRKRKVVDFVALRALKINKRKPPGQELPARARSRADAGTVKYVLAV